MIVLANEQELLDRYPPGSYFYYEREGVYPIKNIQRHLPKGWSWLLEKGDSAMLAFRAYKGDKHGREQYRIYARYAA